MGTPLTSSSDATATPTLDLTPREIEVCSLHFVDCHPQPIIADWLGLTLQTVRQCIARCLARYPQLRAVYRPTPRPRIIAFSQLNARDRTRGPFNADEL
jgi:hypothetical protein